MTPRPYEIAVPERVLVDLRERLDRTRWPHVVPGAGWDYGIDIGYVKELCAYWRAEYDWREHERRLNRYPQYMCEVDGIDLHFWHVRGTGPTPFPLLLVHGWPGSIFEFLETIGPLTDPGAHGGDPNDAFDVVIPALPGFGFGGRPEVAGWGVSRIAEAFDSLMREQLGYERYGAQGGDWGTVVCGRLGLNHADRVVGIHINMPYAPPPEGSGEPDPFGYPETGYFHIQSTKPDTVTAAQADSPAGLAAWIVEKFRAWGDCEADDVERAFSKDTLLTNLMFYWAPNSTASAARIYCEAFREAQTPFRHEQVVVPTGIARFPREPIAAPRAWLEPLYNIVHWTDMPRGGHFAALEVPELLVEDVRTFFRPLRS